MDFPSGNRDYRRLCNYDNQSLRERFKQSRKDWQAQRTWERDED